MPTIENAHFTRRTQPCDRDLKERFLSFVCLFIFAIRISGFILSAFSHPHPHPHPPSAGIRSTFYRHPFVLCDLRLCAQSVLSKSVWSIYFAFSRVYYLHSSRYSVWGFDLRMFDDCLYSVRRFDLRLCANFVLSGSVWSINFPLPRVYDLADDLP